MNIILSIHHPMDINAGAAGVTYQLSKEYSKLGHQVEIYSFNNLPSQIPGKLKTLLYPFFLAFYLWRKARNIDVVDAATNDAWVWCLTRRKLSRPYMVTRNHGLEHIYYADQLEEARQGKLYLSWRNRLYWGKIRLWQVATTLRRADLIFMLNHRDAEYAVDRLKVKSAKIAIVPNGLPDSFISLAVVIEPLLNDAPIKIAQVGVYQSRKGIAYVEAAFNQILSRYPQVEVTFFGTGVPVNQVKAHYAVEVQDQIKVVPYYQHNQLPEMLKTFHIKVLPSVTEGFGMSLIEAMACGLAPIATKTGGPLEIIQHEQNGLLVEARNSDAIEQALERLINDKVLLQRLRNNAYTSVQSYSWASIAKRELSLYERLRLEAVRHNRKKTA